ncbi:MAG: diguanylate cyclase [Sphingomicrobium sp.]
MQPEAKRPGEPTRARRADIAVAKPHLATADDTALLGALPIAAAVIGRKPDGLLTVLAHNSRFVDAVERSSCVSPHWDSADCLKAGAIAELFKEFFSNPLSPGELDLKDGEGAAASYLPIKLAPLPKGDGAMLRCLMSVVDRTVEIQVERTLRGEMLRDSMTGLPNRLAFTEQLEKTGEEVAGDVEHAVLVIDLLRFSRINESMGSLAGDELLITFARRLMSALRGGDVLARTGGNEFGVLVAFRRGIEDALTAASRIQEVTSAPFRLSDMQIKVECAIELAMMHGGQDSEELFRNAQFAVKQAKQTGRPQIYEPKEANLARRGAWLRQRPGLLFRQAARARGSARLLELAPPPVGLAGRIFGRTREAVTLRSMRDTASIEQLVAASPLAAVVTNPRQPDNPIEAVNSAFCKLTGYPQDEIIGRNCRFLAGPETEPWITAELREAIANRRSALAEILNYRRDGTAFLNGVMITPLFGPDGELAWFLGSQVDLGPRASGSLVTRRQRAEHLVAELSPRQREVLELLAKGLLNKQIAFSLELSEKTVKMHRALLFRRLGVATTAEAIRMAVEAGF